MKQFPVIFGGIFAVFALSFIGLVMIPQVQLGSIQPFVDEESGDIYPIAAGGEAQQGRAVYAANGCAYCHTQQVRDPYNSADIQRGWGGVKPGDGRRSVTRDYIYDQPMLLGVARNGPDLANVGVRKDDKDPFRYSAAWHYLHLYHPQQMSPSSIMPSFRYLFETRKIVGQRSADALNLTEPDAPDAGYEVVPTAEGRSLVAYLMSLDHTHPLAEAGMETSQPAAAPAPAGAAAAAGATPAASAAGGKK